MINLNATEIFIFKKLTDSKEFAIQKKNNSYNLIIVNENSLFNKNKRVIEETRLLLTAIQHYYEKIIFNIV